MFASMISRLLFFGTVCAWLSFLVACDRKSFRDEIVYTGVASGLGPAGGPEPSELDNDSPLPRSPREVERDAASDEPSDEPSGPRFTKAGLLRAISRCALDGYEQFRSTTERLVLSAERYAKDLHDDKQADVQQAWLESMLTWQELELFQFGPAATTASQDPGARDLRDQIYGWPLISRCRIEEQLVERAYEASDFGQSLLNGRTLAALDYLLFSTDSNNACSQFSTINTEGSWDALTATELRQRKADYALSVARGVDASARELLDAWLEEQGDFTGQFENAGSEDSVYTNQQAAFDAVGVALFYLDKDVKDAKLALPLGFLPECPKTSCPEAFESQYAHVSTLYLHRNLKGFEQLYAGCGTGERSLGFQNWLREVGASDLERRMTAALDEAKSAVDDLDPPLEDALVVDRSQVEGLHATIKGVTDLLKTEFVTVLDLELPAAVATDND